MIETWGKFSEFLLFFNTLIEILYKLGTSISFGLKKFYRIHQAAII